MLVTTKWLNIATLRRRTRLKFVYRKQSTLSLQVKLCEVPHVCKSEEWGSVVQESRAALMQNANRQRGNLATDIPSTQKVLKRLQETSRGNNYLVETFRQLLSNTECNNTEIRWPGLVTLLLSMGVGSPFLADDFVSRALEDVVWSSQVTLAEVVNLLYCKLLFQKENRRLETSMKKNKRTAKDVDVLVDAFFTSSALRMVSTLKNDKVLFLLSKVLESFAEKKSSRTDSHHFLIRNIHDWQRNTIYPQGLLLAAGCQSALELAGLEETSQDLAFRFGEYFTLAIKANGDLQQFWNYQRSHSSLINLSSFPIALHLTNHPETLEYLYSSDETLDNLNYNKLNTLLMNNAAMDEAKQQLEIYVQKAITILQEFPCFKNVEIIELLFKLTKTLENIDKK
ncbi:hypothetical protein JTE90_005460 [Oedothorax gibbosus]|uniref:Uncharacterized protein n=1 Tax=Oedothorax gibbosus TaxID=931172 RepID=A0AAV6U4V4_9ARAC|nr:hypothetical protein JTE90_005460 [Oedothorax gibbosus]